MTNTLAVATATATHGGSLPSPVTILLIVAAIGYVLWSRMQGRPVKIRRLIVLPIVLAVLGINDLTGSSAAHLTPKDVGFLAAGITASAVLGAARGATIQIYPNQGQVWQRYRKSTVGLWIALIVVKIVLLAIAGSAGASAGGGTSSLLLSLGVSLLAEAAIVAPRAMSSGLPFATGRNDSNAQGTDSRRAGRGPLHRLLDNAPTSPATETGHVVRPPAVTLTKAPRNGQAMWVPPQPTARYRGDRYRADRRRTRRGPIHRLLGADDNRYPNGS